MSTGGAGGTGGASIGGTGGRGTGGQVQRAGRVGRQHAHGPEALRRVLPDVERVRLRILCRRRLLQQRLRRGLPLLRARRFARDLRAGGGGFARPARYVHGGGDHDVRSLGAVRRSRRVPALPDGHVCGEQTCVGDTFTPVATCDGQGSCRTPPGVSCAPFGCHASAGRCNSGCPAGDSICPEGCYCAGDESCFPRKDPGVACGSNHECKSGFCVGGACCGAGCS